MGLVKDENRAVSAILALEKSSYRFHRVNSPFRSHKIMDALKLKKSKVGWFTLAGGVLGFFTGFFLAIYTSLQWQLIVGGRPVIALIPFVIVGFEFTILFGVFGNVIGLLTQMRLPSFRGLLHYDPRCSGDYFGILASCKKEQQEELKDFFREKGAEVRVFEKLLS